MTDLRLALRSKMSTRQFWWAIRLEVVLQLPEDLSDFPAGTVRSVAPRPVPCEWPGQPWCACRGGGPGWAILPLRRIPSWPEGLPQRGGMFDHLRRSDVMLHHPFGRLTRWCSSCREAVYINVLAIKQTIYRTGSESVWICCWKPVRRARKCWLWWAEGPLRRGQHQLGRTSGSTGCPGGGGIVDLKTHAKMMLVTRREGAPAPLPPT